ncbi:MAG: ATP-binding protein [Bacteroidetes bacterium]|nr:ATP-binding protein [Bacteroidota bacterium]
MIKRDLEEDILNASKKIEVITITGPRQSGKTTLAKKIFSDYKYINLELPLNRQIALNDPQVFFSNKENIIFDEIQNVPDLFSYIQVEVDENKIKGQFILTGSQNFSLLDKISQSLAGRTFIYELLPLSISELSNTKYFEKEYKKHLFKGFYPKIYDENLESRKWLESYIKTYIERDLREITQVKDLGIFYLFLKLCAGRIGQLINYNSLSNEIGVSNNTIKQWLGILERSYIIYTLRPYYNNFNKRIIKCPKLYFYDTGLACYLLEITDYKQLDFHFMKGSLFENYIISDIIKNNYNAGYSPNIYFWRDSNGNEIDCLEEKNGKIRAIEIKSSKTFNLDHLKNLRYFKNIANTSLESSYLVYDGEQKFSFDDINLIPWEEFLTKK